MIKEIKMCCYDQDMIELWAELQTRYVDEPDVISERMVESLIGMYGEECFPTGVKVYPDYLEITFELGPNGELKCC